MRMTQIELLKTESAGFEQGLRKVFINKLRIMPEEDFPRRGGG